MREEFERWKKDNGRALQMRSNLDSREEYGAWLAWVGRQPEIDALKEKLESREAQMETVGGIERELRNELARYKEALAPQEDLMRTIGNLQMGLGALKAERNAHRDNAQQLAEENAALKAENERLRKDAERLDFIENSHLEISESEEGFVINRVTGYPNDREWHQVGEGETIREAIDAAMADKGE